VSLNDKPSMQREAKIALWLIACSCFVVGLEYLGLSLAPLYSNTIVIGPGVLVVPIAGIWGGVATAYVAITGRIPRWVWKSQREEFQRLMDSPQQFLLIAIFVSIVLISVSTWMLTLLVKGE